MAVVVSFTLSDADAQRIAAVATAYGFANGKAWVAQLLRDQVKQYETGQAAATAQANYLSTVQPVNPT